MHEDYQYGLHNGQLVHVNDVESGLKCSCICPYCKKTFVAHKGIKNKYHFKHFSAENCKYSYETALHYRAKEIISQKKYLRLPANSYYLLKKAWLWNSNNGPLNVMSYIQEVKFDKIEVETWEGNFRPDLKCYIGNKVLYIEITVTSGIGHDKHQKFKELKTPVFEFKLSKFGRDINEEALRKVLYDGDVGRWVNNPKDEHLKASFDDKIARVTQFLNLNKQKLTLYGKKRELYNCPIRNSNNKSKVPYTKICIACPYFVSTQTIYGDWEIGEFDERYLMCIGHKKVEFESLLDEVGAWSDLDELNKKNELKASGRYPTQNEIEEDDLN